MNIQSKLLIENNSLIDAEIYLYRQAVIYQDWLLVPVILEKGFYITMHKESFITMKGRSLILRTKNFIR